MNPLMLGINQFYLHSEILVNIRKRYNIECSLKLERAFLTASVRLNEWITLLGVSYLVPVVPASQRVEVLFVAVLVIIKKCWSAQQWVLHKHLQSNYNNNYNIYKGRLAVLKQVLKEKHWPFCRNSDFSEGGSALDETWGLHNGALKRFQSRASFERALTPAQHKFEVVLKKSFFALLLAEP